METGCGSREKVAAGEVVDAAGTPIDPDTPFEPDSFVFLYRDPVPERRVPFEIEILYRDSDLLVIDKPHFLATMPRGFYIVESALVRLRRELDLPDLSPLHRLDRVTAGVLMFSLRPSSAAPTSSCSRTGRSPSTTRRSRRTGRTQPCRGRCAAGSSRNGERRRPTRCPASRTARRRIELLDVRGDGRPVRPAPGTGKVHQLRLHMCSLGLPIRNDNFYPKLLDIPPYDYSSPLQLLAKSVAFDDPFTGERRAFESRRTLATWPT